MEEKGGLQKLKGVAGAALLGLVLGAAAAIVMASIVIGLLVGLVIAGAGALWLAARTRRTRR